MGDGDNNQAKIIMSLGLCHGRSREHRWRSKREQGLQLLADECHRECDWGANNALGGLIGGIGGLSGASFITLSSATSAGRLQIGHGKHLYIITIAMAPAAFHAKKTVQVNVNTALRPITRIGHAR
jgi:hypothetical protein